MNERILLDTSAWIAFLRPQQGLELKTEIQQALDKEFVYICEPVQTELLVGSRDAKSFEYLKTGRIDLVINIPKNYREEELSNDYLIRRTAVDCSIPLLTDAALARQYIAAWDSFSPEQLDVASWQEYMARLAK